ncbi:hypothetical protein [Luteipulveratus mongoliensis]|uniref:hypothetical protein n=1 Tax=Luteipulveratus mongoliensis TaxID=571913 RepID=UPI0012ED3D52|nr:hypothetical protein [Luteipulveratus mongoliensis]
MTRSRRRALLDAVIRDVCNGAESLSELDFAAACRARGLPTPSRQVLRRGPKGRIYLDVAWEDLGVAVEIDGAHHGWGLGAVEDALRDNNVRLDGLLTLRIPVLGWRMDQRAFMDQVERALVAAAERAELQKVRAS